DILILASTKSEAGKYRWIAQRYLESTLHLRVNEQKTKLTNTDQGVRYLGFIISRHGVRIDPKKVRNFKDKVRKLTKRNRAGGVEVLIDELNDLLRGFANYFRIGQVKSLYSKLMSWIRRRLRMKKMRDWKSWKGLHKQLRRQGYQGSFEKISMSRWRGSSNRLVQQALPNDWFTQIGLYNMDRVKTNILHQYYE
ncbi:MAG: group II intron maturase-specific domain-containing protein, partial [Bacteroidota bacterium]